jgi:hypothetical protein
MRYAKTLKVNHEFSHFHRLTLSKGILKLPDENAPMAMIKMPSKIAVLIRFGFKGLVRNQDFPNSRIYPTNLVLMQQSELNIPDNKLHNSEILNLCIFNY